MATFFNLLNPTKEEIEIVWLSSVTDKNKLGEHKQSFPLTPDFTQFATDDADILKLNLSHADRERTRQEVRDCERNLSPSEPPESENPCKDKYFLPISPCSTPHSNREMGNVSFDSSIFAPSTSGAVPTQSTPIVTAETQCSSMWPSTLSDDDSIMISPSPVCDATSVIDPPKTLPPDIMNRMWPTEEIPSSSVVPLTNVDKLSNNLKVLSAQPLTKEKLAEIRERVTKDIHMLRLEEETESKKFKLSPVVWDLENKASGSASQTEITGKMKRLQVTDLSQGPSPNKRRVILKINEDGEPSYEWVRGEPLNIPTTANTPPDLPQTPPSKPRKILKAKKTKVIRKCRICGIENKNLKSHLAMEHLGSVWWGALGDQTCWRCQEYHYPCDISQCDGQYLPLVHRELFAARHKEFVQFLYEDMGVKGPSEFIAKVRELGLHSRSTSEFSDREQYFLHEIDRIYSLPKKTTHCASNPTRLSEIFHWKTLTEVQVYLSEAGHISGNRTRGKIVSIVDARCDLLSLYKAENHSGSLGQLPLVDKELARYPVKCIIGEINDPCTELGKVQQLMSDPLVRISLGVSPDKAVTVSQEYYDFCFDNVRHNRVAGVGGLGIVGNPGSATYGIQRQVMVDYLALAASCGKAVRIYSTGNLHETLKIVTASVDKHQPVHLLNFCGNFEMAHSFLSGFSNGYIGVSGQICDPSPALLNAVRKIPIQRMIVESNCPKQPISYQTKSKPTDIVKIINTLSCIKKMDANTVAKHIRKNVSKLYHF